MDNLHQMLNAFQGEGKSHTSFSNAKHVEVFREFLAHLDKVSRAQGARAKSSAQKDAAKNKTSRKSGKR